MKSFFFLFSSSFCYFPLYKLSSWIAELIALFHLFLFIILRMKLFLTTLFFLPLLTNRMVFSFMIGLQVCVNVEKKREMQILAEQWKRKRREEKKCKFHSLSIFPFYYPISSSLLGFLVAFKSSFACFARRSRAKEKGEEKIERGKEIKELSV